MRIRLLICAWVVSLPAMVCAEEKVDYLRDVKPILSARCYACHSALRQRSGLRLDTGALIRRGGDSGEAIVPGKAKESLLIDMITADVDSRMPPEAEGEPLKADEIAVLRKWIDQGALAPDEPTPTDPRKHWSYQPPVRPALPKVARSEWVRNPIDAFLAASYERQGLKPVGAAAKHVLLRRVYFDLVGLPPTRAQLNAFLADTSSQAYENAVDQLLESPRHGERWARHWMDVWRYSDWSGYKSEIRNSRPHIWRWRDWIIESVNQDKGYDRMVLEMLAADELSPTDADALRATGYLVRNWYKFNRNTWLEGTVEHTAKAFLGVTINCCKCHDHKFDPIAQEDFYRMRAIFEPHDVRADQVAGQIDTTKDGLARAYDVKLTEPTYLFERGNEKRPVKDEPIEPGVPDVLGGSFQVEPVALPVEAYYPYVQDVVVDNLTKAAEAKVKAAEARLVKAQADQKAAAEKLAAFKPAPETAAKVESTPATANKSDSSVAFLHDDFAKPRPDVWTTHGGEWKYADGHVTQSQVGAKWCKMTTKSTHPQDFAARFRFKPTGGQKYKSVGISFDDTDQRYDFVYVSAINSGPVVSVGHHVNGKESYPATGRESVPVKVGQSVLLEVQARDRLINVSVDGLLMFAYELPAQRRPGRIGVFTFDASAELHEIHVEALPAEVKLTKATAPPVKIEQPAAKKPAEAPTKAALETAVAKTEAAVQLAEKQLVAARVEVASVAARVAADRAKYANPPDPQKDALAMAAGRAQAEWTLRNAEVGVLAAEQKLAEAAASGKADDKKTKDAVNKATQALAAAKKTLASAQTAYEKPTASYAALGKEFPRTSSGRRLALARWIANRENPLTARVAVNHIWMRHFGSPLVDNVFDFGVRAKSARNHELLDWLAVELMENRWSMKHLHRLIVTSSAYRMRSSSDDADAANIAADPDNRLLWRMNVRRLEAEVVRDSMLHVAENLELTMGGPEIDQNSGQQVRRRSVYFRHAYEKQMKFLELFDGASVNECYRRSESIVPQQALALANSQLSLDQSRVLARKLNQQASAQDGDESFVRLAFEQILSRIPADDEVSACSEFLNNQHALLSDKAKLTALAGRSAAQVKPSTDAALRARENLVHVLMNHNDFVTVR